MSDRDGIFAGEDPYALLRSWIGEASKSEVNDPEAMSLATVDRDGLPNVRVVLLKDVDDDGIVFYTNYGSAKGQELISAGKAAVVFHWKSLRRQVRLRGTVEKVPGERSDEYYRSRALQSRLGAWASQQSQPLESRGKLMAEVARLTVSKGPNPPRPDHWGGFKLRASEVEFWADGAFRLHDRFRWIKQTGEKNWTVSRLYP